MIAEQATTEAEGKELMRRFFDELPNKGNLDAADELFAADVAYHLPDNAVHGVEGVKGVISTFRGAFPDLRVTIEDMLAEGERVATRVTVRGTHRGELMGIAATGTQAVWSATHISCVREGRIVEDRIEVDQLGLLRQLGAVPAPSGA